MRARGHPTRLVVAEETGPSRLSRLDAASAPSPWVELEPGDLVVARGRHPFALALLKEAEARGARTYESWSAVIRVRNKVSMALALARRGLPTPATFLAHAPEDLSDVPDRLFPLVLKPFQGDNAEGIVIVGSRAELSTLEWEEPMVVAQPYIDAGGVDLKLYVAGTSVWATRRTSPLLGSGEPATAEVTPELNALARGCGEVFGLRLLGIDVLESSDRPVVVDVNEFPNYAGVDEAPEVIGRLLAAEAGAEAVEPSELVPG